MRVIDQHGLSDIRLEHVEDRIGRRDIDPGKVLDLSLPLDQVADGYPAMDRRGAIKALVWS